MKILIITFNFAPRASSQAIRTVNLAKQLKVAGNQLEILTYDADSLTLFSPYDDLLSRKVGGEMIVNRIPSGPLRRWLSSRKKGGGDVQTTKSRLSKNPVTSFFIPDPHAESIISFYRAARQIIKRFDPEIIITHGYPFSTHVVGGLLKRNHKNIFWIADYGDPWSGAPISELYRPAWRTWLDYKIEKYLLRHVDLVTVTTKPTQDLYIRQFPQVKNKIEIIPMGYDPDDFSGIDSIRRRTDDLSRIWFVYTGRLYSEARNPEPFFSAIELLYKKYPDINNLISIIFVGEVDKDILAQINKSPVKEIFRLVSWVPFEESVAWMKSADYLLLFGNLGEMQIPGKIFQYMGAEKPIILFYESEQDPTIEMLKYCSSSVCIGNNTDEILALFDSTISSKRITPEKTVEEYDDPSDMVYFRWENILKRLLDRIKHQTTS